MFIALLQNTVMPGIDYEYELSRDDEFTAALTFHAISALQLFQWG